MIRAGFDDRQIAAEISPAMADSESISGLWQKPENAGRFFGQAASRAGRREAFTGKTTVQILSCVHRRVLAIPCTLIYAASMDRSSDLSGIAAMLAATVFFVVGDSFMKLVTEDLPPFEVLFLRSIAASLACPVFVALRGDRRGISGVLDLRALLRAAGETLSTLCYIVSLARMPIANVIAILQTGPLILILGAAFLLRERIGRARVALALVGFAGALMVAQPSPGGVPPAALLAFGAALLGAARDLVGRGVPTSIPVTVVILATMLMMIVAAGVMSRGLETWVAPTGRHLAFLGVAGLCVAFGHFGLLLAYWLGRTSTVAPFFYSFALWGVVSGLIVWAELPNALALAGIALIPRSGIATLVLDQRRGRKEIALSDAL